MVGTGRPSSLMALFVVMLVVAMVLSTVPYSWWRDSKGKREVPPLDQQRGDFEATTGETEFQLQRLNPDLLTLAAWGDRLNCSTVQHRDCESEAAEMAEVARRVLAPAGVCKGCVHETPAVGTKTCTSRKTGRRGFCVTAPVKEGDVVIRRRPASSSSDANVFPAGLGQFIQVMTALEGQLTLQCNLAMWPYPDVEADRQGQTLLPFSITAFMNHADLDDDDADVEDAPTNNNSIGTDDDSATVCCAFYDDNFVTECLAARDIAVGEQLTFDYWDNFLEDPGWLRDLKRRAGVLVKIESHNMAWYL